MTSGRAFEEYEGGELSIGYIVCSICVSTKKRITLQQLQKGETHTMTHFNAVTLIGAVFVNYMYEQYGLTVDVI